ncbi:MAG TPA: hypothetical protein VFS82_01390 [Lysobacter sp.]|nr:hypothetical protein [Lysobacter sp.]
MKPFIGRLVVMLVWLLILNSSGAPQWAALSLSMVIAYLAIPAPKEVSET